MNDPDVSPLAAVAMLLGFGLGTMLGFSVGGWMGGLLGAIGGSVIVLLGHHRVSRGAPKSLAGPLRSMDGLSPEQAVKLIAAQGKTSEPRNEDGVSFKSELLTRLEEIAGRADGEPRVALAQVEQLRDEHPRSPAVWSELTRRRLALDRPEEAWEALSQAIRYALDGGMNPLAAKLISEFPEGRDAIELDLSHERRLRKVLLHQGDEDAAKWARRLEK